MSMNLEEYTLRITQRQMGMDGLTVVLSHALGGSLSFLLSEFMELTLEQKILLLDKGISTLAKIDTPTISETDSISGSQVAVLIPPDFIPTSILEFPRKWEELTSNPFNYESIKVIEN